jgi:hypothetical protein
MMHSGKTTGENDNGATVWQKKVELGGIRIAGDPGEVL